MPMDLPDMKEEIEKVEYCALDSQGRVELDAGKGAQLFNLAAAMCDEADERLDETYDADATYATESQFERHRERVEGQDDALVSVETGVTGSQQAVVNGTCSGEVSTEVSGDEDEGSAGGEEQERQTTDKHKGQQGEGPSSREGLNPRGEGTSSRQGKQPEEQQRRPKRGSDNQQRGNSMHWCNVADDIPCDMDVGGCELTRACDNQVVKDNVEVLAAEWLCDDKERGQAQKGLYYTGSDILAKGTWIATFGVLRESTTMEQHNGYSLLVRVGESGEGMKGSRRNWSRKLVRATMVAGWENKVKGPWINHSCCAVHCNCEYVPTEFVRDRKGGSFSVNVRTTRDVKSTGGGPVEFLVDYGEDYLKVLGGKCRCCAHTRATAQCRFARAR